MTDLFDLSGRHAVITGSSRGHGFRWRAAGRWGQPEELAGTAVILASEASNFVNGQIIYVDGGILAAL